MMKRMDIKINSIISRISFLILFIFLLQGCASSNVSRGAASQFNSTVSQGSSLNSDSLSLSESYQGTNQTTKGVLFGGAAGALAGGVTSGGAGIIPCMAGGAIFGGALGAYIDENVTLADQLISSYPNMSVKVAAYTTPIGPERINRALSAEQANAVVKYLWRTRMNTRLLYAEGYGGSNPVEKPDMSDWAGGDNYRVEITLEKLPV